MLILDVRVPRQFSRADGKNQPTGYSTILAVCRRAVFATPMSTFVSTLMIQATPCRLRLDSRELVCTKYLAH